MEKHSEKNNFYKITLAIVTVGLMIIVIILVINHKEKPLSQKPTSINLPVTILPTEDGISGDGLYADKYPSTISVANATDFSNQIGVYGAGYEEWVGPEGWTGSGGSGADGNTSVDLYPPGGSPDYGPHIYYQGIPACVGCMLTDAAPYFSNAMDQYNQFYGQDTTPIPLPEGIQVTAISSTLITYTLPTAGGFLTKGVVYYNPNHDGENDGYFAKAEFVLPEDENSLADFLVQTFIDRKQLK